VTNVTASCDLPFQNRITHHVRLQVDPSKNTKHGGYHVVLQNPIMLLDADNNVRASGTNLVFVDNCTAHHDGFCVDLDSPASTVTNVTASGVLFHNSTTHQVGFQVDPLKIQSMVG
jgi:hypothetical protein